MGIWFVAAAAMVLCAPAQAQDWPSKPVTFITPAAAGNSPDVVGRIVADKLSQMWKQQAVVLNRPGAGGLIAAQAAAAVEKDGYSLYMSQASTFNVLPVQRLRISTAIASALKMRSGASSTQPPCASLFTSRTPRGSRGFASGAIGSVSVTSFLRSGAGRGRLRNAGRLIR